MNHNKSFQLYKLGVSSLALGAALLSAQGKCDAAAVPQQGQQQPQTQQPPAPAGRQHKVWTNDDVVLLRTPTDNYLAEKEARDAANAEAAAKEAVIRAALKSDKEMPLDITLPTTPEKTEKMLNETQADIREEELVLDKLRKEVVDSPMERQAENQKEIGRLTATLEMLRRDVKALQDHLRAFDRKPAEENAPVPPRPPSV